jgi:hypothetical protein
MIAKKWDSRAFYRAGLAFFGLSGSKSTANTSKLATPSIALIKQLPTLSIEPGRAQLLYRLMISGAGVECDSGQQPRKRDTVKALRLTQDVLTRKVTAALLKQIN